MKKSSGRKGFTLIELVVVIGILAILLAIVLIAINPSRQFKQANDTRRRSDVNAVLNAVGQYYADHKGVLPSGVTTTDQAIKFDAANICSDIMPDYISALPVDPTKGSGITDCSTEYDSGYNIIKDSAGRVTVSAPGAELGTISITR